MAEASDGSLRFDTGVDTSGFDKGSDKLLSSIQQLVDTVKSMGENMTKAFEAISPVLQSVATNTAQIYQAIAAGAGQAAQQQQAAAAAAQQQGQAAQQAAQQAQGAQVQMQNATAGTSQATRALTADLARMEQALQAGFSNGASAIRFDDLLQRAQADANALRERMVQLKQTRIPTEDYTFLQGEMQKAQAALDRLIDRQSRLKELGVKENSKQWQGLELDIANAQRRVEQYQADLAGMQQAGLTHTTGAQTAEYQQLAQLLKQANDKIQNGRELIQAKELEQARLNAQVAQENYLRSIGTNREKAAYNQLLNARRELAALQNTLSGPTQAEINAPTALAAALDKVRTAAGSAASNLAKAFGSALQNGIKSAAKGVQNLVSHVRQLMTHSKAAVPGVNGLVKALTGFKTMLKSRIKRMFMTYVINEIKEGFSALVKYSADFDKTISDMRNITSELAANIAVTVSTIVNAIGPAITAAVGFINTLITRLNALFAMLQGKQTVTVAKKQTDSYADSLRGVSKAAKAAKGSLASFDQITTIGSGSDSGSGSGTGGAADGSDRFQDVLVDAVVPEDISGWFQNIKAAFENQDWEGLGTTVTQGLNQPMWALQRWVSETLPAQVLPWSANIGKTVNGLFEGIDGQAIGATIGAALTLAIETAQTFLGELKFDMIGNRVGSGIQAAIDFVRWDELGTLIGTGITGALKFAGGLLDSLDPESIGMDLSSFVNHLNESIDWVTLGDDLAKGFNFAATTFDTAVSNTDWTSIGENIGTTINTWFTGTNWTEVGTSLGHGFQGAVDFLGGFLKQTDWRGICTNLGQVINGFVNGVDWASVGNTAGQFFIDIFNGISGFLEEVDWQQIPLKVAEFLGGVDWAGIISAIVEAIGAIIGGAAGLAAGIWELIKDEWQKVVDWWKDKAFDDGGFTIEGLLDGITEALTNIGTWVKDHIFTPLWNGITSAFGINSPSKEMKKIGNYIIDGLKEGVENSWKNIKEFFTNKLDDIKTSFSNAWTNIKSAASSKWEEIKSTISSKVTSIKTSIENTSWSSIGSNIVAGLKGGITGAWNTLTKAVSDGMANLTKTAEDEVKVRSPSKVFYGIGNYIDQGLANGIKENQAGAIRATQRMADGVISGMDGLSPSMDLDFSSTLTGLNAVASTLSNIAASLAAISQTLTQMGGLQIPAIAAGSVLPYKTRLGLDDESAGAAQGAASTDLLERILTVLNELNSKELSVESPEIYMDGIKLTRQIVRNANNMTRAAGQSVFLV